MKNEKSKNETTITVNLPNDVLEGAKEVVEIVNNYLSANAYRDDLFGNLEERKLFDLGFVLGSFRELVIDKDFVVDRITNSIEDYVKEQNETDKILN
jgi:hypothetical protein